MLRYESTDWREAMRIRLDYNNMMSDSVGSYGITDVELKGMALRADAAAQYMIDHRDGMKWRELPYNQTEILKDIIHTAKRVGEQFDNFVVLGIGGSALGPIAVQQALSHMRYNELDRARRGGPRLYVEDNIDPERMAGLMDVLDVERTMFNVITKSGSTSETMSQLMYAVDALKSRLGEGWPSHIIATTDEKKGNLIRIAKQFGIKTFFVPDGVGGRFSELCPVGLLAAAVCGIDIRELLSGAAYMDALCSEQDYMNNPAYLMAALSVLAMEKGVNISVLMPYADSLKYMADWYAQLWAESLGKNVDLDGAPVRRGQTPAKSLGVTDQHSQVQLYTEGPFDKMVTFLAVDNYRSEVPIPHAFDDIPDVAFLSGHTFNELISAERYATEYALTKSGHTNQTITLPEVNPFTVGQLLCLFELTTAFAGALLNINAFDQPGVEEGKNATYALLGKAGYDEKRTELASAPKKNAMRVL